MPTCCKVSGQRRLSLKAEWQSLWLVAGLALGLMPQAAHCTEYWLFRHAEKQVGVDPGLTSQGRARAERIAKLVLTEAGNHCQLRLYSTDYRRTRETLAPLADMLGQAVTFYDPQQLAAFAKSLEGLDGCVVVVGHSNTTVALLQLLSGEKNLRSMAEDSFELLYHLIPGGNGYRIEQLSSNP